MASIRLGSVVIFRYIDHVLFRNTDPSLFQLAIRKCWLEKEDALAVWVVWDRSAEKLPHEKTRPEESGLVIHKSNILRMWKIG